MTETRSRGWIYQREDGLFAHIVESHTHTGQHFEIRWTDDLIQATHYPMRNWLQFALRPKVQERLDRFGCGPGTYRPIDIVKTLTG